MIACAWHSVPRDIRVFFCAGIRTRFSHLYHIQPSAKPERKPKPRYDLNTTCQPCPSSVDEINYIVIATAAVGGASTLICLSIVATIVAHGHDRVSMRDRIIVGLMLANAVYVRR